MTYTIRQISERAVSILFPEKITEEIHQQVMATTRLFQGRFPGVLTDTVPSYHQVTLFFRRRISYAEAHEWIDKVLNQTQTGGGGLHGRTITLPVLYGGEWGPDLEHVASVTGLSDQEVIDRHTAGVYTVFMLGFLPGFPYLGGLDDRLNTPRRDTPRQSVPAGSVGIAGAQTGVYPLASPGGWQLIGRTPRQLVDVHHPEPCLVRPGDQLRFVAITKADYQAMEKEAKQHVDH
ncbi:5-oxoprolinase subunit PxpB [Salisediminibacterium beveridgei]|uniref:Allophanate hydrolase n=1 Tax=Salisediminibacterium beveridgei TaxID=632773 RepID=A0A1D7QSA2_9BACI|nr:5-oxoprolinase subunit PxpB [Salisediminibacterium beveridgei]AOM81868.1 allophanate hydrolase [Salisediminibacterium beveridgei]